MMDARAAGRRRRKKEKERDKEGRDRRHGEEWRPGPRLTGRDPRGRGE